MHLFKFKFGTEIDYIKRLKIRKNEGKINKKTGEEIKAMGLRRTCQLVRTIRMKVGLRR
jgi:hypothetical protein